MKRNEFFFKSKDNNTNIHMVVWEPEDKIYGILHINHGLGEDILKYEDMALFLNKGGLVVTGIDIIGHGSSDNNGTNKLYFNNYKCIVEDINTSVQYVKQLYTDVPYIMLGFDIGAYLSMDYLLDYTNIIDGIILTGINYKSKFKLNGIKKKIDKEIKKLGDTSISTKIDKVIDKNSLFSSLNVPLMVYSELISLMQDISSKNISDIYKSKPIYLMYGTNDKFSSNGKEVLLFDKYLKKNGYSDITIKEYPSTDHYLLQGVNKYDIYNDIYGYIRLKLLRNVPIAKDQVLSNGVSAYDDSNIKAMQEDYLKKKQSSSTDDVNGNII